MTRKRKENPGIVFQCSHYRQFTNLLRSHPHTNEADIKWRHDDGNRLVDHITYCDWRIALPDIYTCTYKNEGINI